jgi:hypothetical protein
VVARPATHGHPEKRGLPQGAIFGISFGGAALGLLILFLFLRRGAGKGDARTDAVASADAFIASVLDPFERTELAPPARPAARTYLKLCDEFLQSFAGHAKAGWVQGKRAAYAPVAMEWDSPTLQDAMVEARTNVRRHRYGAAKEALEDYLRRTPGSPDAAEAKSEIATIEGSGRERFEERFDRCRDQLSRAAFSVGTSRSQYLDQALLFLDEAQEAVAGLDAALLAKARGERDRIRSEFAYVAGAGR